MADTFDFISAYRDLQPSAARETVEAREAAHKTLVISAGESEARVWEVCRAAFGLPPTNEEAFRAWFERPVQEADRFFSITHDKAEVQRIATLILADWVHAKTLWACAAVLASAVGGLRNNSDIAPVVIKANQALAENAKSRRSTPSVPKIDSPKSVDRKGVFEKVSTEFTPTNVRPALDALAADIQNQGARLANSFTAAIKTIVDDNLRLSEEVNLLWWHLGAFSELLECSHSQIPKEYLPLVVGIDMASLIEDLPGPLGAYGIIRRSLGGEADTETSLLEAVTAIPSPHADQLRSVIENDTNGTFPISFALHSEVNRKSFARDFKFRAGFDPSAKITHFELATQAYREAMFHLHGWVEQ